MKESIRDAWTKFKENPETNQDKLLKILNSYKEEWIRERESVQDGRWRTNLAFFAGEHYIRDSSLTSSSQYRVRLKENHTNNAISRMQSIFVQNMPIVRVFPNSSDYDDERDAEITESYGKFFWRTKRQEQKYTRLIKYVSIFGSAFTFTNYDHYAKGKMILDPQETQSGDKEIMEYKGDINTEVDDPFKWCVRPGMDLFDDMYDIIRSVPANKFMLEAKYGKIDADAVKSYSVHNSKLRDDEERVMLNHYWHKPTSWFPEGLYACWVGNKLLKVRPATESEDALPCRYLAFDKVPLRFWGLSGIDQIIDLQEQLNKAGSMIIEARNLMSRPRVLASNESKIPAQALTDRPGEIIRYAQAGGPPIFQTPNFNFAEMAAHKSDLRNALNSVIGMTSASRGDIPSATRTALALQLVLEQDRSQYLPFIREYHQTILDTQLQIFKTAAEYLTEDDPRVIKIEGKNTGTVFHGGLVPSPIDCYLEDTNPLGWTAAGRIEQVGNLIDRGVITDRNEILEMLKINSTDPAYDTLKINKEAAAKEIDLMNKGQFLDIMPEDDDAIHLDEHTKVVASFSYRSLPQVVKEAHIAHIEQHKARVQPPQAVNPDQSGVNLSGQLGAPSPGQNIEALLGKK